MFYISIKYYVVFILFILQILVIILLGISPREMKTYFHKETHTWFCFQFPKIRNNQNVLSDVTDKTSVSEWG